MNTIEIRKCDAKIILLKKQISEESKADRDSTHTQQIIDQLEQHKEILDESTKQNLHKRHEMKQKFFQNYK
jgi:hypothetical protein